MIEMKSLQNTACKLRIALVTAFAFLAVTQAQAAVTWAWKNGVAPTDAAIKTRITDAMNNATYHYNLYATLTRTIPVQYNSSVKTADASYLGTIRFGGSRNDSTAHHESSHIFGVGTQSKWAPFVSSTGEWTGATAKAKYKSYEGQTAVLKADKWHFWKYGMNYGWENPERHVKMVVALRSDMKI